MLCACWVNILRKLDCSLIRKDERNLSHLPCICSISPPDKYSILGPQILMLIQCLHADTTHRHIQYTVYSTCIYKVMHIRTLSLYIYTYSIKGYYMVPRRYCMGFMFERQENISQVSAANEWDIVVATRTYNVTVSLNYHVMFYSIYYTVLYRQWHY